MKSLIKTLIKKSGYNLSKISPYEYKYSWIRDMNIKSIIDIGANEGQFAFGIMKHLPDATIFSFEPLLSPYLKLNSNSKNTKIKCYNLGIGDKNEIIEINHTKDGDFTSSILDIAEGHKRNFPNWTNTFKEKIEIITLDSFFNSNEIDENIYMKIDVQGYEDKVLLGADKSLSRIKFIQMETSYIELYKDQKLFDYFYKYLTNKGFNFCGIVDSIYDKYSGQPIYCDTLFINRNL